MNNKFDKEQEGSQAPRESPCRGLELTKRQAEIHRNLKSIGPEIAAYYLDGLKILYSKDLEAAASFLAHAAREIDGGLRNILSMGKKEELEFVVRMPNGDTLTEEKKKEGTLKFAIDTPGNVKVRYSQIGKHKPSILQSLGVNEPSPLANRWIEVTGKFYEFVHRHGAWKLPHSIEDFEPIWHEFEEVLASLVGSYLNLLSKVVDRILEYEEPTEEIRGVLPNLLKSEARCAYFFRELEFPAWLGPLKEDGWFNPDQNPIRQEDPDQLGNFYHPTWYALEYAMKVCTHLESSVDVLVDIVDSIISYTDSNGERIKNRRTDLQVIQIVGTFPIDRIEFQHIAFMGTALRFKRKYGLVDQEIAEKILPKFLDASKKDLALMLLKVILQAEVVAREITTKTENRWPKVTKRDVVSTMEEYWLRRVVKNHSEAIAKLCGIKAAEIALTQIRKLIAQDPHSFDRILIVAREPSNASYKDYPELLVNFINTIFQFTSADVVKESVTTLIQETIPLDPNIQSLRGLRAIFGLIALKAITYHYDSLKSLLWNWPNNPFGELELRPELRRLIRMRCQYFDSGELDQILHWIKSYEYHYEKNAKKRIKIEAKLKREWLSMLLKTGNERVIPAYKKYDRLCAENTESSETMPKSGAIGPVRPLTVNELSKMSNAEIADYLSHYKEQEIIGLSVLTGRGLADTLSECVAANPQRFTDNLLPFQDVRNLYQSALLQGFLTAWRDKKKFDWAVLLGFIHQILASKHFWDEQYEADFNYRNWVLSGAADLIARGTKDDTHAFDVQLFPLAEDILLTLVEKAQQSVSNLDNLPTDVLNSDRGRVFSAMVDYALRFAHTNESEYTDCRWPYAIRADFTKRLDRSVEPSLEFSYTLGVYLPNLLYLDEEWVIRNLSHIFRQQDELHWQAAFSGYLLYSGIYEDLYSLFKAHGHYQKAMDTNFADDEVIEALVAHICIGWIKDWEMLDDDTSLIYQLMSTGTSESFSAVVHFFLERGDKLRENNEPEKVKAYEQVKAKIKPAWGVLFEELSKNSELVEYQEVLGPLSGWLGLIDTIDVEVLSWMKESIRHINKPSGYYITISRVIKALLKHVSKTPEAVAEIYLKIPQRVLTDLQTEEDEISETVRILYNNGYKDIADTICNRFGKAGVNFLRSVYAEHQT